MNYRLYPFWKYIHIMDSGYESEEIAEVIEEAG
jgi:hypothetical protein